MNTARSTSLLCREQETYLEPSAVVEKEIVVHIGPHKTGSTSIQHGLAQNETVLASRGIRFFHGESTHRAALLLAQGSDDEATEILKSIAEQIGQIKEPKIIISQEDFCGELPGRTRRAAIYPRLVRNVRIISRALAAHRLKFLFFSRPNEDWLRSCYHQHLKYRTFFSAFDDFRAHFEGAGGLESRAARCLEKFPENFIVVPYSKEKNAGISAVLQQIGEPNLRLVSEFSDKNISPPAATIKLLERVNQLSDFKATAWFCKKLILENKTLLGPRADEPRAKSSKYPEISHLAFPDLSRRAGNRFSRQSVEDVLPAHDVDLTPLIFDILPRDGELPDIPRTKMSDQSRILDYHLRGKSQLAKLNALTISYLRRDTSLTSKARHLFHRVWREHGVLLINELSTRWLISTLQTFLDHGMTEEQRLIGCCGYFYSNMVKIYEGERAIEGREQDGIYARTTAQTPNRFPGLDRYTVGGSDLLLNTNALALDLSMRDEVAGLVLQEFLLRMQHAANVFTRMDRTRSHYGIEISNFEDTWSFFKPPQ